MSCCPSIIIAVEPDPGAADFARSQYRLDVKASTLQEAGYDPASFDAVVMLHVLAHLDDPAATVQAIARVLRPGGILMVETPVYDTLMVSPARQARAQPELRRPHCFLCEPHAARSARTVRNTRDMVRVFARKSACATPN